MARSMTRRLIFIACLTYLTTGIAFAGGSGRVKITQINLRTDGSMVAVSVNGAYINDIGCGGSGMYVIERERIGQAAFDAAVRQLTAALLANSTVEFFLDRCSSQRHWGQTRPHIFDIRLNRE